jgi:hypothetical protein
LRAVLLGLGGGTLLGLALRLLLFLLGGLVVRALAGLAAQLIELVPSVDPVYTRAAVWSLSELRFQGLAIGGLSLARLVIEPGSPVLARLLAAAFADACVLTVGLLLVRAGWLRRKPLLVCAGLATQVQVALAVVDQHPSLGELESTGLAFAANALLPWLSPRDATISDAVGGVSPPLLVAALVGLALLVGYVPGGLVLLARRRAWSVSAATALCVVVSSAACATLWRPAPAPAAELHPRVRERLALLGAAWDRWLVEHAPNLPRQTSRVAIVQVADGENRFQLLVEGRPQVLQGMGLNTQYMRTMTPEQRAARLDADLATMQAIGINTIVGWDQREFDGTLLDLAHEHDVGVVMPFDIDPTTDFTDREVRAALTRRVLDWVASYRSYPAVRMWGLGNEVLHKIVHPVWLGGPQEPSRVVAARAFVDWLIETADAVHAADPDHLVTYRDAEDAFANWIVEGLHRHGLPEARLWFVWGANCYTNHLDQVVGNWPRVGMESPLWVSEFAPGGLAIPDRPNGWQEMWTTIRANRNWVLGGAAYAWTRNGPEGVDRNLGLTDDGMPVDGAQLDRLALLFHAD